jgi:hypothetical protein
VLVGYVGTIDTELMAGEDGVVAKIGAEGLLSIAVWVARAVLGLRADTGAPAMRDAPPVLSSRDEVVGRLEVAP